MFIACVVSEVVANLPNFYAGLLAQILYFYNTSDFKRWCAAFEQSK